MKTSLIISTYNWPKALSVVLESLLAQSLFPEEVIIADDGSSEETKITIDLFKQKCPIPLYHIWHEDNGFKKSVILNKAVKKASGKYIIQIDGDCIMNHCFIEDHIKNIEKGTYLFGSRVNIKEEAVNNVLNNKIIKYNFISPLIRNKTRAIHSNLISKAYSKNESLSPKFRGCNTSFFKSDFESVNGYNEDFEGWGREDSELAYRFHNLGLSGKRLRYCGIVYHIYHKELSKNKLPINNSIEKETILNKKIWTKNGYNNHIKYEKYNKKDVCIVIPIYKVELTDIEKISLKRCVSFLSDYSIYFIQPKSLDSYSISFENTIKTKTFDESFFKGILGYNKLLLSHQLYAAFADYKYMLIYQLDCYLFSDRLLYWCNKDYDYIGAPWIASKNTALKKILSSFDNKNKKRRSKIFFHVGNGGFSLRKINTFSFITKEFKPDIEKDLLRNPKDYKLMEDVFWSFKAPELFPKFKIPSYKKALKFSIDRKPELALKKNNNRLPFGCHGINKPKVIGFWKKNIPEMNNLKP